MKKILILGAGEMQVPIIQKSNSLGYKTIVTDHSEDAPGLNIAKIPLIIDTLDNEGTLKAAKKYRVDGILTTSDAPVNTVAYVCNKLGLPGISQEAAKIGTNKYLQRKILSRNELNCPKYLHSQSYSKIVQEVEKLVFPVIVKPVDSSASRGVSKVDSLGQLRVAFNEAKHFSKSGSVIVEEFVMGREYSVETLTQKGKTFIIAITEKSVKKNSNFFVEERHVIPAELTPQEKDEITIYVNQIIKLFKINDSASHIELLLTNDGPVLVELGVRLGGDFITSHLVPLATGVDMQKNIISLALNERIEISVSRNSFAGVQFVHGENYEDAQKMISREDYFVEADLKDYKNTPIKSSLDRLGHFIFQEETRKNLLQKLNFRQK